MFWWNLVSLRRWVLTLDHSKAFLFSIHTDGHGRIRIDWIAAPVRPLPYRLPEKRPRSHDLADLDLQSRLIARISRPCLIASAGEANWVSWEEGCFATLEPG